MVVGLGTGSTAAFVVRRVGELIAGGELTDIRGIATSERTAALAREIGIPLLTLSEARPVVTIDGADEIGSSLALIKGRGGALLRGKIVAPAGGAGSLVFVTDGGHYTADCLFPSIPDPATLEAEIKRIPGALESGLFVGLSRAAVVARGDGVEVIGT